MNESDGQFIGYLVAGFVIVGFFVGFTKLSAIVGVIVGLAACVFCIWIYFVKRDEAIEQKGVVATQHVIKKRTIELGLYDVVSKKATPHEFFDLVFSQYGQALKADYRRIAGEDNYGRVSDNKMELWNKHLIEIVDSCKLNERGVELRTYLKQMILIKNTPTRHLKKQTEFDKILSNPSGEFDLDLTMDEILSLHPELKEDNFLFVTNGLTPSIDNSINEQDIYFLDADEIHLVDGYGPAANAYKKMIKSHFNTYIKKVPEIEFNKGMSGLDYEKFCADILRENGWGVTELPGSGDHGADLLAEKNNISVAIQCKHYSKPLDNTPVQEIVAAQMHYKTTYAAVVASSSYTKGAMTLASSNHVKLFHHDDLPSLEHHYF